MPWNDRRMTQRSKQQRIFFYRHKQQQQQNGKRATEMIHEEKKMRAEHRGEGNKRKKKRLKIMEIKFRVKNLFIYVGRRCVLTHVVYNVLLILFLDSLPHFSPQHFAVATVTGYGYIPCAWAKIQNYEKKEDII